MSQSTPTITIILLLFWANSSFTNTGDLGQETKAAINDKLKVEHRP